MTKTQAAQKAQAYADSMPESNFTRIVELSTRYIVLVHAGQYRSKRTFLFDSEYAGHDQGC